MAKAQAIKEETTLKKTEPTNLPISRSIILNNPVSSMANMRRIAEDMENMLSNFGFGRRLFSPKWANDFLLPRGSALDDIFFTPENVELFDQWSPQIEILQKDNQLIVRADLPGIKKEDVEVQIDDNLLILKGERKREDVESKEGFYRNECFYGNFYRRIPLPEGVKTENAKATFNNGVLEIAIDAPQLNNVGRRLVITEG